ncbi:hypothetical protein [Streptomyces sp. SCL15-4]|uniref:hypothetical protein n=1 Tax=Streptomyces sp. SCL15-4 TaxID=2967221 RepID=UPI0029667355|nr:hypothetical protein [Streptomyces sp. SCL15-4]
MSTTRQNPDGSCSPATPLPLTNGLDVEVHGTGPYVWQAWIGLDRIASGRARTRPGLQFAIWRARRQAAKRAQR